MTKEMRLKSVIPTAGWVLTSILFVLLSGEMLIRMAYYAEGLVMPEMVTQMLDASTMGAAIIYVTWRFIAFLWSNRVKFLHKFEAICVLLVVGYVCYWYLISGGDLVVVIIAIVLGIAAGLLDLRILGKEEFVVVVLAEDQIPVAAEIELEEQVA